MIPAWGQGLGEGMGKTGSWRSPSFPSGPVPSRRGDPDRKRGEERRESRL